MAEAIVETCLASGQNVVIDKFFSDKEVIGRFIELGKKYKAEVHEFVLNASKEFVIKRADDRGYREGSLLTLEKVQRFWEDTQEYIKKRQGAVVVDIEKLSPEEVYQYIAERI